MKKIDFINILQTTGLSEKEVLVLKILLEQGQVPVRDIVKKTALNRGTVYSILKSLTAKNLALMVDVKKILHASPNHPENISDYIKQRKNEILLAEQNYNNAYPEILSIFNKSHSLPTVQFLEGVDGLKWVYNDILAEKKDILLIRSFYDHAQEDLKDALAIQIASQVRRKIKVRALTPIVTGTKYNYMNSDKKNLVTRRMIPFETFTLEAQIMIYSDKVAITAMKGPIFTTWIKNNSINQSMRVMFEFIWENAKQYHQNILKKWGKEGTGI